MCICAVKKAKNLKAYEFPRTRFKLFEMILPYNL